MRTIRTGMPWALTMLAVLCPALTGPALAGDLKRVALVVGNGGYDPANISRLDNPVNDARLLARTLERVDFEVSLVTDAEQDAMKRAIKAFGKRLRAAGRDAVGLFYYAGHGVESGGSNYLIPLGAEVESAMDLASDAVPAQWVLSRMEAAGNRLNMVILEARRPIRHYASLAQRKKARGEIGAPPARQNHKPRVVAHQVQPVILHPQIPTNPGVTRPALPCRQGQAHQRHPLIMPASDVPPCLADLGQRTEKMVRLHQALVASFVPGRDRLDHDLAQVHLAPEPRVILAQVLPHSRGEVRY